MSGSDNENHILILFAHPAFQKSRVNTVLRRHVQDVPGVTFRDLYEAYPDFDIDVPTEQALLTDHSIVVLQHPFFWYSTPAILKEWQDLVLQHGWAYGSTGHALRGKILLNAVTTGGPARAYCRDGRNRFTMRELLAPIEQTARLCGMRFLPPFVTHGTHRMTPPEMEAHARDYRTLLEALMDDSVDLDAADRYPRINHDLKSILRRGAGASAVRGSANPL